MSTNNAPIPSDGHSRTSSLHEPAASPIVSHQPQVVIDGVSIEATRLTLLPIEVARVMRVDESDVRNMIRRGELSDVSRDGRRRLDPDEVIVAVEARVRCGELGAHVFVELAALISGKLPG
jgi:hypothetical protein